MSAAMNELQAAPSSPEEAPQLVKYAVVFRLYPNEQQAAEMRRWIGTCRALWNHLLAGQRFCREVREPLITLKEMEQERQRWEQVEGCEWRQAPQSQARQQVGKDLARAISDYFKSLKGERKGPRLEFPRFKAKRPGGTIYIANARFKVADGGARVELAKIGAMRLRGRRKALDLLNYDPDFKKKGKALACGEARILAARVRLAADRWFLAVQVEAAAPPREYGKPSLPVIGIDVGLKAAVARSDGKVIEAPRFFRKAEKRLKRLSRRLSASEKGSARGRLKARKVARLQARIADHRRDFLHTASTRIVAKAEMVCLETLSIKGMARGRMAKSVADAGMGELHRQIAYKAEWAGRKVVRLGRFDRSTGVCPDCGTVGPKLPLRKRSWSCAECGEAHDRDIAAARVIARAGMEQVRRVTPEPSPEMAATRVEMGDQVQPASPVVPVPVVEARSAKAARPKRGGGLGRRISARTGNADGGEISGTLSLGPLFEWSQ